MAETAQILLNLFIMYAGARLMGEVFHRLKQPAVVGELLVGIGLGVVAFPVHSPVYEAIAEIGAIVLLFYVGLEMRASDIFRVGATAARVAVLGVALPLGLGYGVMALLGYTTPVAVFVGTALVATSVGITARVLKDLGVLSATEARVILGAAVIDDVLGMVLLAGVSGLGDGQWWYVLLLVVEAVSFTLFVSLVATRVVRRYGSLLEHLRISNAPLTVAIIVLLGLSALSAFIGLAAIIGAFLAGMMFAETRDRYPLEHQVEPLHDFLVPFFFVVMGTMVDVSLFMRGEILGLALLITTVAILGKLLGGVLGGYSLGRLSATIVGVGMVPRGEVGIIVALLGLRLDLIDSTLYGVVLFTVIVTTLLSPPLLEALFYRRARGMSLEGEGP
ncbi:MAG: cation:proton antiporter [Chloroflexi bacterium]|nr:cation:proton antiporter [Chloroflexota bacterium]